ncbi:hypothetical protein V6N13_109568 [Hibiscus sabdariffa]
MIGLWAYSNTLVGAHVIKMMGYIQALEKLGFPLNVELAIDVVLQSLPDSFNQFVLNFNMNEINKTLPQLLGMLRTAESNMKKGGSKSILMVHEVKGKGKKVAKSRGIDVKKAKAVGALVSGLHMRRNLAKGDVDLRVGNGARVAALAVGTYVLCLPSGLVLNLENYYFVPSLTKNIISVNGVRTRLVLRKMTKAPFSGKGERASDLLGLIHSDVCGPMYTQARGGFQYFITFTDDFSRYGYIYLMRHKSEALERFKEYKNEAQNQHGKTAFTLNRVLSKSVQKTPHEMWTGKRPGMSFMKESFLKRSFSRTMGMVEILNLKKFNNNRSLNQKLNKLLKLLRKNSTTLETQPLRRSTRERHNPERYGFLVTTHGDVILVDQDEPKTYQEAVSSPDCEKWLEAIRSEMDSMLENQV